MPKECLARLPLPSFFCFPGFTLPASEKQPLSNFTGRTTLRCPLD
jgi:hypothetical protein